MALNDYIMAVDSTIEYFYATHPDISLCVFLTINRINGIKGNEVNETGTYEVLP